jgi:hypothetical protein
MGEGETKRDKPRSEQPIQTRPARVKPKGQEVEGEQGLLARFGWRLRSPAGQPGKHTFVIAYPRLYHLRRVCHRF